MRNCYFSVVDEEAYDNSASMIQEAKRILDYQKDERTLYNWSLGDLSYALNKRRKVFSERKLKLLKPLLLQSTLRKRKAFVFKED